MDTVEPFGTPGHLENLLQENMSLSVTNCILNYVLGYSIQIKTFLTHLPTIYCLIVPHGPYPHVWGVRFSRPPWYRLSCPRSASYPSPLPQITVWPKHSISGFPILSTHLDIAAIMLREKSYPMFSDYNWFHKLGEAFSEGALGMLNEYYSILLRVYFNCCPASNF